MDVLSKTGINWNDFGVLSKTGINWNDFGVLSRTGINWNDLGCVKPRQGSIGMILEVIEQDGHQLE